MPALILASTSRYRKELLGRLGVEFTVSAPEVDETTVAGESPLDTALRLARLKALAVAAGRRDALVIGSDQTATLDGVTVIGKPGEHARAVEQLRAASGRVMTFHTGLSVIHLARGFERTVAIDTRVRFRTLSDAQIERYLAREPAYDCAGSAKSEGLGISLLEGIEGSDPTALVGLPLIALTGLLADAGIAIP
jgi:septum formation protein